MDYSRFQDKTGMDAQSRGWKVGCRKNDGNRQSDGETEGRRGLPFVAHKTQIIRSLVSVDAFARVFPPDLPCCQKEKKMHGFAVFVKEYKKEYRPSHRPITPSSSIAGRHFVSLRRMDACPALLLGLHVALSHLLLLGSSAALLASLS